MCRENDNQKLVAEIFYLTDSGKIVSKEIADTMPLVFINYFDNTNLVPRKVPIDKRKLFDVFCKTTKLEITMHDFFVWIKNYCMMNAYVLNPEQNGRRHSINGREYITIF